MGISCGSPLTLQDSRAKSQLDDNLGRGAAGALQRVAEVLTRVDMTVFGSKTMSHPVLVNLGILFRQVEQEQRYATPVTSFEEYTDSRVLSRAVRYSRYAAAAYHDDPASIAGRVGGMDSDDVKFVYADDGVCPSFFATVDPATHEIVLSVRGSATAEEALNEAVCAKESFLGGSVHGGLLHLARYVAERARDVMVRLSTESPRRSLAFVGHGVGASAALLAMILLCGDGSPFARLMAASKVKCYAFGALPTFEPLWALPPWVGAATFSFVNGVDCVPRTCVGTCGRLLLALRRIDSMPLAEMQRLALIRGDCQLGHSLLDAEEIPPQLSVKASSLFLIGTILLLYRGDDCRTHCDAAMPQMVDKILLHHSMFSDHGVMSYEQAVAAAHTRLRSASLCC